MNNSYSFSAIIWIYGFPEVTSWFFVTVPKEYAEEIKARTGDYRRGFGSERVSVACGTSTWQTSIFPDKKSGSYLLPIKKEIRTKEKLKDGDSAKITLTLL
jgi:hypothetical protein